MVKIVKIGIVFLFVLLSARIVLNIDYRFVYTGDSLNKLIQAKGLTEYGYSAERLYYPFEYSDPKYELYPFPGVYLIEVNGKFMGQYPYLFSLFTSFLVKFLGYKYLFLYSVFAFSISCFILKKYWKLDIYFILLAGLITNLLIGSIDTMRQCLWFCWVYWA